MKIQLKLFATLATFRPDSAQCYELPDGSTVEDLIATLGIPEKEVHLIFIDNAHAERETVIKDGARVALFPAVGGG
ncbi:MAG: MoaD/ThiS family protein [Deltaproteobacteria bacterium]|nr:MoaD/ThiS family protein [Deltaproteobacteria bacterium]